MLKLPHISQCEELRRTIGKKLVVRVGMWVWDKKITCHAVSLGWAWLCEEVQIGLPSCFYPSPPVVTSKGQETLCVCLCACDWDRESVCCFWISSSPLTFLLCLFTHQMKACSPQLPSFSQPPGLTWKYWQDFLFVAPDKSSTLGLHYLLTSPAPTHHGSLNATAQVCVCVSV